MPSPSIPRAGLEIRLHGRGGQGGVTCAKILAAVYASLDEVARCPCGGRLRPHIVFFGEIPLEMLRIERIVKPAEVAHEVETYNELIPAPGELSACLLIEYEDAEERDVRLRELLAERDADVV